jgi:superfamily I DNA and/or RNA helicase
VRAGSELQFVTAKAITCNSHARANEHRIISMTTSGADDMPRDVEFQMSSNRLNVAISRARCLAVLIASPGPFDLVANSVDEMRLCE